MNNLKEEDEYAAATRPFVFPLGVDEGLPEPVEEEEEEEQAEVFPYVICLFFAAIEFLNLVSLVK